jgi:2'-hydroxyisoflavone reductase
LAEKGAHGVNLLIIGGTVFLGRHLVEAAQARGHRVTLFNRGQHNPELFPEVEKLRGNRDGDLGALAGRRWDAVIDTCGYYPRVVRQSAELLAGAVERYAFISTISVFVDESLHRQDESGRVGMLEDETIETITGASYGPLKALCERAVEQALPGRALIVRPGLIVGPHDPTDRFTYWPALTQIVDVRDLAEWTVRAVEAGATGPYNAAGPEQPLSMGVVLDTCRASAGSDARFTWVPQDFLLAREVAPFMEMPLWVPEAEEGLMDVDCGKAIGAGLTFRPLETTVRDTLAWDATRAPGERRAGMKPEREQALLAEWHAQ